MCEGMHEGEMLARRRESIIGFYRIRSGDTDLLELVLANSKFHLSMSLQHHDVIAIPRLIGIGDHTSAGQSGMWMRSRKGGFR